jgi:hypothetical protein
MQSTTSIRRALLLAAFAALALASSADAAVTSAAPAVVAGATGTLTVSAAAPQTSRAEVDVSLTAPVSAETTLELSGYGCDSLGCDPLPQVRRLTLKPDGRAVSQHASVNARTGALSTVYAELVDPATGSYAATIGVRI